ncbi:H-NS family nucleoid-associated regulatory protein [Solilutibacter pythonis]|uniref:H-NS histone family protein n=1 Tax=Solilutibacter pythonis TaxID=2483112 RepID=UPI001FEBFCF4|nr:H-NS histone family protein [Lysobacter pythonis]
MDITNLNSKELADLISQAQKRKKVLAKRKPINQVRASINKIVRTSGYTFEDLFGSVGNTPKTTRARKAASKAPRKATAKVEPKYRNPANAQETWTGRGKQPRWLAAYVATGRQVEEFLINKG